MPETGWHSEHPGTAAPHQVARYSWLRGLNATPARFGPTSPRPDTATGRAPSGPATSPEIRPGRSRPAQMTASVRSQRGSLSEVAASNAQPDCSDRSSAPAAVAALSSLRVQTNGPVGLLHCQITRYWSATAL